MVESNSDANPHLITYEHIEAKVVLWVQKQTNIRAVLVSGSRARIDHPADKWSDLDLVIIGFPPIDTTTRNKWITGIVSEIGDVWLTAFGKSETNHPDWIPLITFLTGRLQVEVLLVVVPGSDSPSVSLGEILARSPYPYVFSSGVRVLYDLYAFPGKMCLLDTSDYRLENPSETDFQNTLDLFWLHALQVVHLVRRGELWRASQIYNCELKKTLLLFIEWHARVRNGPDYKIWPRGRFLEEWADPRVVKVLHNHLTANEPSLLCQSVLLICDLLSWVVREIANDLGYLYPTEKETRIHDWLNDISESENDGIRPITG